MLEGRHLDFTPEALKLIAKKAMESETGTRALRSIIENVMIDITFDMPSYPEIKDYTITPEIIENGFDIKLLVKKAAAIAKEKPKSA